MERKKMFRIRTVYLLAALLMLGSCGYRAPLHLSYIPEVTDSTRYEGVRSDYVPLAALMDKDTELPPTRGNTLAIINDHKQKYELLMQDLRGADESIYLDHYRFIVDSCGRQVSQLLQAKAADGKDVRLVLDKKAHLRKYRKPLLEMPSYGVKLGFFNFPKYPIDLFPLISFNRNHRKILLIDAQLAYIGGRNIQDKYFTSWRDADLRITGPAVRDLSAVYRLNQQRVMPEAGAVHEKDDSTLLAAAARDSLSSLRQFYGTTVQIVYDNPDDRRLPIRNCWEWSIRKAQRYFWFYTPYTPPPRSTIEALKEAARRGVDVRWIAPGKSDLLVAKWMDISLYQELLEAGVRIFEWQDRILHAKQFITDDYLCVVGSANMDNLSFFLNFEDEALVYDEAFARSNAAHFLSDVAQSREVTLEEVRRWSVFRKLWIRFVRLSAGYFS